ncbi:MAG: protein TolR [Sulfuricella sp.]|nr:protein TolR [Sulfuricella sp.]
MRLRKSRRFMNQINVVPYIDVMLVLLIIFMVTAPLINPGQVELPSVGQALKQPEMPLEVEIRADNSLRLRDRAKGSSERRVSHDELVAEVKALQSRNPEQPVVISADKSVRYEEVIKVMDVLQQNQVKRVGLLAKPRTS